MYIDYIVESWTRFMLLRDISLFWAYIVTLCHAALVWRIPSNSTKASLHSPHVAQTLVAALQAKKSRASRTSDGSKAEKRLLYRLSHRVKHRQWNHVKPTFNMFQHHLSRVCAKRHHQSLPIGQVPSAIGHAFRRSWSLSAGKPSQVALNPGQESLSQDMASICQHGKDKVQTCTRILSARTAALQNRNLYADIYGMFMYTACSCSSLCLTVLKLTALRKYSRDLSWTLSSTTRAQFHCGPATSLPAARVLATKGHQLIEQHRMLKHS